MEHHSGYALGGVLPQNTMDYRGSKGGAAAGYYGGAEGMPVGGEKFICPGAPVRQERLLTSSSCRCRTTSALEKKSESK